MRRIMVTMAFLALGSLAGCTTTGSSCGTGCGTGGCSTGGCGSGGCGGSSSSSCSSGCGSHGGFMRGHGICDCEFDDYCSSRSPWIRMHGVGSAPVVPAGEMVPAPTKLPDANKKL